MDVPPRAVDQGFDTIVIVPQRSDGCIARSDTSSSKDIRKQTPSSINTSATR